MTVVRPTRSFFSADGKDGTTVRQRRGFAALATLISFLLGMVIVVLGVIGEYLWRIADETNRRPEMVIERVY